MVTDNYRSIKAVQRRELWYIGYYLNYWCEFVYYWCMFYDFGASVAWVSLEREALYKRRIQEYLKYRRRFAWKNYQ